MSGLHWTRTLLFSGLIGLAPAQAREPWLQAPMLLAASPTLDGAYARAVLLVLPSGGGSHVGLILNRPSRVHVATLFPEAHELKRLAAPVYVGGPHLRDTIVALTLSPLRPVGDAVEILPNLFLTLGNGEAAHVAERFAARTRFYAGLVAWERGALEAELQAGDWYALEPDIELMTGGSADTLWQRAFERVSRQLAMRR